MVIRKHIVIIGAGVIGSATAYYLSKSECCKITIVEKVSVACAASGKSGGFLALEWNDELDHVSKLSRASFRLHQELAKALDGAKNYDYRQTDTYEATFNDEYTESASQNPVKWISNPISIKQTGSKETTAQLTPDLFTQTLIKEAEKTGRVEVREGQGVSELLFEDSNCQGVILEDGTTIKADHVVVAMGPWSGQLPLPKGNLAISGEHIHSVILQQDLSANSIFATVLDGPKTEHIVIIPRPNKTVYVCFDNSDGEPLQPSADQVVVDPKAIDVLLSSIGKASELLAQADVLKRQACNLPVGKTDVPLIGPHPSYKNLYVGTGHGRWGMLNSPITGKMLSEWILEGKVTALPQEVAGLFIPK